MASYIKRSIEQVLLAANKEFPALVLTGPRQCGKTTLLLHLFGKKYHYISLESPDIRMQAKTDPRGFLDLYPPPVIFDEVQYAPELLFYIKEDIDKNRERKGQYLLTGSQNLLLLQNVTESLAGRAAILNLLPLAFREINDFANKMLPWEVPTNKIDFLDSTMVDIWSQFLHGCYPELIADPKRDCFLWHASYMQTYLERDVRNLRQIGDLTQFQIFLRTLASRSAQLLN